MPICEIDPGRAHYFETVACPTDVFIPTEAPDAKTPPSFEGGVFRLVAGERNQLYLLLQAAA